MGDRFIGDSEKNPLYPKDLDKFLQCFAYGKYVNSLIYLSDKFFLYSLNEKHQRYILTKKFSNCFYKKM